MGAFFMMQMEAGYRLMGESSIKNQNLPLISIVTVVYNSEEYIERTIQSILKQTYPNIEHVILDGASKDNTVDVIKKYSEKIAYWKSEKDEGIYDAMNKAQLLCTGEYIMFLNSGDEFYDENVLSNSINLNQNADVFYGDTLITDDRGNPLKQRRLRPPMNLSWKNFRVGMLVCHQSIIIKRKLSEQYDTQYRIAADIDWAIRSIKHAKIIVNTNQTISKFMEGGMSNIHHRRGLEERYAILNKHFGYIPNFIAHLYILGRLIKQKIIG